MKPLKLLSLAVVLMAAAVMPTATMANPDSVMWDVRVSYSYGAGSSSTCPTNVSLRTQSASAHDRQYEVFGYWFPPSPSQFEHSEDGPPCGVAVPTALIGDMETIYYDESLSEWVCPASLSQLENTLNGLPGGFSGIVELFTYVSSSNQQFVVRFEMVDPDCGWTEVQYLYNRQELVCSPFRKCDWYDKLKGMGVEIPPNPNTPTSEILQCANILSSSNSNPWSLTGDDPITPECADMLEMLRICRILKYWPNYPDPPTTFPIEPHPSEINERIHPWEMPPRKTKPNCIPGTTIPWYWTNVFPLEPMQGQLINDTWTITSLGSEYSTITSTTEGLDVEFPSTASRGAVMYSTNGVQFGPGGWAWGYVVITIPPGGSKLIGHPFKTDTHTLNEQFAYRDGDDQACKLPAETCYLLFDTNGVWRPFFVDEGQWSPDGNVKTIIGQGGMLMNPSHDQELKFVIHGASVVGSFTNAIRAGWSVVSHVNGKSGYLDDLGFPHDSATIVKRWDADNAQWLTYDSSNWSSAWIDYGEAVFVYQSTAKQWVQNGDHPPTLAASPGGSGTIVLNGSNLVPGQHYTIETAGTLTGTWSDYDDFTASTTSAALGNYSSGGASVFFRLKDDADGIGNVVGGYSVSVPAGGYKAFGMQFDYNGNNTIANLIPTADSGTMVWKRVGNAWTTNTYTTSWSSTTMTAGPGDGCMLYNPAATAKTFYFCGSVLEGYKTLALAANCVVSLPVPLAGSVSTALGLSPVDGDQVHLHTGSGWTDTHLFDELIPGWDPHEPSLSVGESFWFIGTAQDWTITP